MDSVLFRLKSPVDLATAIVMLGLAAGVVAGVALAAEPKYGVAIVFGIVYAGIALVNLPLGFALWVPLIFLEGIPAFNLAGKAAGAIIAIAWVGSLYARRDVVRAAIARHRRLLATLLALLVWLTLSLVWADDLALAARDVWRWYVLLMIFVIAITTVTTERALRWLLFAFIGGAVMSIVIGVADGSFTGTADGAARLEGGTGDPNYLAASIVACSIVAVSLLAIPIRLVARWAIGAALLVLVIGLVMSGSRGGFLAAGGAIVTAFFVFKYRRAYVLAATAVIIGIGALAFLNVPDAWERMTDFNEDNGRSSLWTVGARMWEDQPVTGVGLNNFVVHSADYVREPGTLENTELVVERPHVPHNTYLQILAEAGVVGLALFLLVCAGCVRAAMLAAREFEARGEMGLGTLTRGIVVATASVLAASMFLSATTDKRLWLLLALGPVMLGLARRVQSMPPAPAPRAGLRDRAQPVQPRGPSPVHP
ncbi:MAG: O-antigen ligase family protein [Actinomycetota bacterium]|nr:O-antigen ligase family protein [Actinomycetota bacterium]